MTPREKGKPANDADRSAENVVEESTDDQAIVVVARGKAVPVVSVEGVNPETSLPETISNAGGVEETAKESNESPTETPPVDPEGADASLNDASAGDEESGEEPSDDGDGALGAADNSEEAEVGDNVSGEVSEVSADEGNPASTLATGEDQSAGEVDAPDEGSHSGDSSDLALGDGVSEGTADDASDSSDSRESDASEHNSPSPSVPRVEKRQLQQVDGAFGRFRRWLKGSTTVGRPLVRSEEASPEESETAPPETHTAPAMTPAAVKKEIRTLRGSRRSWESLIADREEKAEAAQAAIEVNSRKIRALNDWVTNFDRSYQWRVQQRMDQQLQQAENDLKAYEQSAHNVEEFEVGRLSELRRSFHRLIRQILVVTVPIGLATVLIPIIFQIPRVDALETFYDPRLSAPIITLVVVAVIAAIFLFRRASGKDTIRNITIVKWVAVTIVAGFIVIIAPVFEDQMRNVLVPYLETNQARILLILGAITFLWIVVALVIYYRGWSQYRRAIDTQLARLHAVISGYVETQQEVNRLTLLYQQTSEWLRILAFALYRPWVTPSEWEDAAHQESDVKDFPFALRIAQVDDQVGAKSAELERIISSKLLVQGWRANAFRDLVDEVRKDMGLAQGKLSVDALDKDLPHQTNNTRNLLRKYLEASASAITGGEDDSRVNTSYLVEVARKRLLDLIEQTQSVALSAARPPVNHIVSDPLEEIVGEAGPLLALDESENWDGFLKETLGTDEIVQPPLSILNFTPDGQMNKVGESPKTFVLIPQRLVDALPGPVSESVNLIPVTDNSSRAVEIIVRVDVVGPLKPSDVRLLSPSGSKVSAMSRESRAAETRIAELCRECFDPTCAASIDRSSPCSSSGL